MLNILLLEDDSIDYELISRALEKNSIENLTTHVTNRQDFLAHLNTQTPDLILADYSLPSFNGLSALDLAQSICPDVPFILVSGLLGEEQAIESLQRGATDYVLKQRLERLGPAVRRALREQHERRERQVVTNALRQTDDLLQAIVDASPVAIITLDRSQKVMTWNPAARDIYGWDADAVGDRPLPVIVDEQRAVFNASFEQVLNNTTISNQEFRHVRQDGSVVDISLSLAPLHNPDHHVYGVVMTAIDITLCKQMEAQRLKLLEQERKARSAAETTSRAKDEFLAVLSHELRTPLNAIVGWIQLIQKRELKPMVMQKALDTIERNATIQTQLIEDMLDISRIIRGQINLNIQPVNMIELLRSTVNSLLPAAQAKSIQVDLNVRSQTDSIWADPNRMQQIFWNLLSNAIKFTPASGRVEICGEMLEKQLNISVIDSGVGITPDFLPHIFEYFRQADGSSTRSQGGLGLGLAITRHLVELHGGTIHADSAGSGQGTTFTVSLPRQRQIPPQSDRPESSEPELSLKGIKVLVVEDEDDTLDLLEVTLEEWGAVVKGFSNVRDALARLNEVCPDIILTDIGLPDEDGYSFLKAIRSHDDSQIRDRPVVALTAHALEGDRQRALAEGFQEYMAKPLVPEALIATILEIVKPS